MNELKQIDEFRKVLSDYQLPEAAKSALEQIELVMLVGPSSSGRNSIINELLKSGSYHYVISDTTRQPRENNGVLEQNGREYWFRTEDEILDDLKAGKFLEAAIIHNQQVSGISIRELQAAADERKIAIDEIEVVGADNIHKVAPEVIFLFILPPSFDEWMVRMNARGTLPEDETRRRLESAINEVSIALDRNFYCFIVNDTFVKTATKVDDIAHGQVISTEEQAAARKVAKQLIADTKAYLNQ
ncbi:MAG TPA: hypothetical protein VFN31_02820 [Candidatus Saccharimonadales bacterium]|nr:hypothetical protein [Candidatus Saccharimonadales bacterium]